MARNRILYIDLLVIAGALYLVMDGYVFHLLLIFLLILPVVSLLAAVPLRKHIFVSLSMDDDMIPKGTTPIAIHIRNDSFLPCLNGRVYFACANALGRTEKRQKEPKNAVAYFSAAPKSVCDIPLIIRMDECGRIDFGIRSVKIADVLGLFNIPVPQSHCVCNTESLYVLPETSFCDVRTQDTADLGFESNSYSNDRPGNDSAEVFDLKDYVPGDSRHSIHWKLSGRMNRLIVKEYSLPLNPAVHFLLEIREGASSSAMENLLGTFLSFSENLVSTQTEHQLSWIDGENGLRTVRIPDTEALGTALHDLLSMPSVPMYTSLNEFAVQDPFLNQLHLVYMIGGSLDELDSEQIRACIPMMLDRHMCERITVMAADCTGSVAKELMALGCDLQMFDGTVPEVEEAE